MRYRFFESKLFTLHINTWRHWRSIHDIAYLSFEMFKNVFVVVEKVNKPCKECLSVSNFPWKPNRVDFPRDIWLERKPPLFQVVLGCHTFFNMESASKAREQQLGVYVHTTNSSFYVISLPLTTSNAIFQRLHWSKHDKSEVLTWQK